MADRQTIVDALERCARLQDAPMSGECAECPYKENFGTCGSLSKLMMDAAKLLKEQPIFYDGQAVGQAVKWDADGA